jgi:16S rRNA (adenine1518-N6/adenine1519-N6)-dimethyltransferase
LIRRLLESDSAPRRLVLTVQREVAERVLAGPGDMNLLALGVQAYGEPHLAARIPASSFYPAPRVESAVLRIDVRVPPRMTPVRAQAVFRAARAGFAQPRKKLRNSLAAGLQVTPPEVERRLTGRNPPSAPTPFAGGSVRAGKRRPGECDNTTRA